MSNEIVQVEVRNVYGNDMITRPTRRPADSNNRPTSVGPNTDSGKQCACCPARCSFVGLGS